MAVLNEKYLVVFGFDYCGLELLDLAVYKLAGEKDIWDAGHARTCSWINILVDTGVIPVRL